MNDASYVAFISYRHVELDKHVAKKLHYLLEHYSIPKELQDENGKSDANDGKFASKRLGRVFRDEEELPASANLSDSIHAAIDHSDFLIVVCSPKTKESIWVRQEIEYFLKGHDRSHLIAVLIEGTPEEAFPDPLTTDYAEDGITVLRLVEPLAANLTDVNHHYDHRRLKKEIFRIYAAIIGCSFDSLWQREKRYQQKRFLMLMTGVTAGMLAFSAYVVLKNQEINRQNTQIISQNEKITDQKNEIETQKNMIEEQLSETKRINAVNNIRDGKALLENGNAYKAIDRALEALQTEEGRKECGIEAYQILRESLGAGQNRMAMRNVMSITQSSKMNEVLLSQDDQRVYTVDVQGIVRCYSIRKGDLLWTSRLYFASYHDYYYGIVNKSRLMEITEFNMLLCCYENQIVALSMEDGSTIWEYSIGAVKDDMYYTDFSCVSPDMQEVILLEGYKASSSNTYNDGLRFVILNTADGSLKKEIDCSNEFGTMELRAVGGKIGDFSEDNRYFFGSVYDKGLFSEEKLFFFLIDLQGEKMQIVREIEAEPEIMAGSYAYSFVAGVTMDAMREKVLVCYYVPKGKQICMEELYWDGRIENSSYTELVMPSLMSMEMGYQVSYDDNNDWLITVTCGSSYFLYRRKDGALLSYKKISDNAILRMDWLQPDRIPEEISYVCLLNDGHYYEYLTDGNVIRMTANFDEMNEYAKPSRISLMDITDQYITGNAKEGADFNSLVTEAVVYSDDRTKVNILVADRDPHIQYEEWGIEDADDSRLIPMGNDLLIACERVKDSKRNVVKVVDLKSNEIVKQYMVKGDVYRIDVTDEEHISFSSDLRHFSNGTYYYDMKEDKAELVFPGYYEYSQVDCNAVCTKKGELLQANVVGKWVMYGGQNGIIQDMRYMPVNKLLWKMDEGRMHVIECPTGKAWDTFGAHNELHMGENGVILIGQYNVRNTNIKSKYWTQYESEPLPESFFVYDTEQNKQYIIEDECPAGSDRMIEMGGTEKLFATVDSDGYLRIYDIESEKVIQKISIGAKEKTYDVKFCEEDRTIAVFVREMILFYDIQTGKRLWSMEIESDFEYQQLDDIGDVNLEIIEDEVNDRVYVSVQIGKIRNIGFVLICLDAKTHKKLFDMKQALGGCLYSRENDRLIILKDWQGKNRVYSLPAYSLEELIAWGNETGKNRRAQ